MPRCGLILIRFKHVVSPGPRDLCDDDLLADLRCCGSVARPSGQVGPGAVGIGRSARQDVQPVVAAAVSTADGKVGAVESHRSGGAGCEVAVAVHVCGRSPARCGTAGSGGGGHRVDRQIFSPAGIGGWIFTAEFVSRAQRMGRSNCAGAVVAVDKGWCGLWCAQRSAPLHAELSERSVRPGGGGSDDGSHLGEPSGKLPEISKILAQIVD